MPVATDQMGRTVAVPRRPRRIVSLVPSQTETLFDLGLDEEVVGVTRFCAHPADRVAGKAVVGGTKRVDLEVVAALAPDLVVGAKEENSRDDIRRLAAAFPVWVSDVRSVPEALDMVRSLGAVVGRSRAARAMAGRITAALAGLRPLEPPRPAAYLVWDRPLMAAGEGTFVGDLLARCGLATVVAGRYPEVTRDDLREAEVVLLPSEPYRFGERHRERFAADLPGAAVLLVDGEAWSWYGSRMERSVPHLREVVERAGAARPGRG